MADQPALLVLQDGTAFRGHAFGGAARSSGEVVFATAMTGYQEMLTDPSFAGQVLVLTYPLAGNYGISRDDVESKRIQVRGLVVHEECGEPSHWDSEMTLREYLASEEHSGNRRRRHALADPQAPQRRRDDGRDHHRRDRPSRRWPGSAPSRATDETDFVREVSTDEAYDWADGRATPGEEARRRRGQRRQVQHHAPACAARLPGDSAAAGRRRPSRSWPQSPDGILFSPGPATRLSSITRWRRCAR